MTATRSVASPVPPQSGGTRKLLSPSAGTLDKDPPFQFQRCYAMPVILTTALSTIMAFVGPVTSYDSNRYCHPIYTCDTFFSAAISRNRAAIRYAIIDGDNITREGYIASNNKLIDLFVDMLLNELELDQVSIAKFGRSIDGILDRKPFFTRRYLNEWRKSCKTNSVFIKDHEATIEFEISGMKYTQKFIKSKNTWKLANLYDPDLMFDLIGRASAVHFNLSYAAISSQTKFLLDTIADIRSNKITKYDQLKRALGSFYLGSN